MFRICAYNYLFVQYKLIIHYRKCNKGIYLCATIYGFEFINLELVILIIFFIIPILFF